MAVLLALTPIQAESTLAVPSLCYWSALVPVTGYLP
jgi:hypothetical protein